MLPETVSPVITSCGRTTPTSTMGGFWALARAGKIKDKTINSASLRCAKPASASCQPLLFSCMGIARHQHSRSQCAKQRKRRYYASRGVNPDRNAFKALPKPEVTSAKLKEVDFRIDIMANKWYSTTPSSKRGPACAECSLKI